MKLKKTFLPACALVLALGSTVALTGCEDSAYDPDMDYERARPLIDVTLDEARGVHGELKTEFRHGRALVQNSDNYWGVINEDGDYILPVVFREVFYFDGKVVIARLYNSSREFFDLEQMEMTRRLFEDYFGHETTRTLSP